MGYKKNLSRYNLYQFFVEKLCANYNANKYIFFQYLSHYNIRHSVLFIIVRIYGTIGMAFGDSCMCSQVFVTKNSGGHPCDHHVA